MKKLWFCLCLLISMFTIVPYGVGRLFQNELSLAEDDYEKLEEFLPYMMYECIDHDMHMETLKAQAIILRTNLLNGDKKEVHIDDFDKMRYLDTIKKIGKEELSFFERMIRACNETKGKVIMYDEKLYQCPYYFCSNGVTRDAFSFFQDTRYPHVIAVPSQKDTLYEEFVTYHYFSKEEFVFLMNELCGNTFDENIDIIKYDKTGYVLCMQIGDKIIGGETFREKLGLSSSCFTIEEVANGIRIGCKGKGHGFGLSQYGANAMAEEGKGYEELLNYYFHNITIENVYTFD